MPVMKEPRKPTDAELAILRVLWSRGPSTVRGVFDALGGEGVYTTVLKLLQIMTDKGLVRRDDTERTHVYEAAYSEDQTQKQIVTDLLDRVFDGSAAKLVLQALEAGRVSSEELADIRKLIQKHREGAASSRSGRTQEATASSRRQGGRR
jgi:predicted transcriptional regulator